MKKQTLTTDYVIAHNIHGNNHTFVMFTIIVLFFKWSQWDMMLMLVLDGCKDDNADVLFYDDLAVSSFNGIVWRSGSVHWALKWHNLWVIS